MLQILRDIIAPAFRRLAESGIDGPSFYSGCCMGFLIAGLVGSISVRILRAWARRNLPDRPMVVPTQGTPRQVMAAAGGAAFAAFGWTVLLILVGVASALVVYLVVQVFG